jgi:Tat protein secretion system quality control protein TatD with DNase activity
VAHTAQKVAELWGCSAEAVAEITGENARRLFRLPG